MPAIVVPTVNKELQKPSKGEVFGNLWQTKGIDLTFNPGKIRLSERMVRFMDSGDDTDFECPVDVIFTDASGGSLWWILTQADASSVSDGLMFKSNGTTIATGDFIQDAISNSPTDAVDKMVVFGQASGTDRLVVARDTDLTILVNGTWTASWWVTTLSQSALTATNRHHIHTFLNTLLVPDGNVVHQIDDALVVTTDKITLPKDYSIIWIADDGNRVYFGTKNIAGGPALVFPWDGVSATYDAPLDAYHSLTYAGIAKDGIMHVVNGEGQLLAHNGNALEEVASFPLRQNLNQWQLQYNSQDTSLHMNGMAIIEGNIHILINAGLRSISGVTEHCHSGIWEYAPEIGLYNKYSVGQYDGVTNDEWGASMLRVVGCLKATDKLNKRFLAGAVVYSDNESTQIKALFAANGNTTQRGYFITSEMHASDVRAFWKRLHCLYSTLTNSTDRIVLKYMVVKDPNFFVDQITTSKATISWTDTDTFTSTDANFANVSVGDEIEIMMGKGAGAMAHVKAISLDGGTYTVDLDETIPNVSGTAKVRLQSWVKLGEISDQNALKELFTVAKRANWIKIKCELRGDNRSPEIEKLFVEFNQSKR